MNKLNQANRPVLSAKNRMHKIYFFALKISYKTLHKPTNYGNLESNITLYIVIINLMKGDHIMPLGRIADILMYAPFVSVYGVPKEIHEKLTIQAFFGENGCYISPDFDNKAQKLLDQTFYATSENMTGDDWPLNVSEALYAIHQGKRDQAELDRWIEQSNDGIFKILGDAGTGKSTFLHYLKWAKNDIEWHILDLKKAIREIKIYGSSINIPHEHFVSLYGKVLSAVILEIRNLLFEKKKGVDAATQSRKNLQKLLHRYDTLIAGEFPLESYVELYENLSKIPLEENSHHCDINYCRACAKVFADYFTEKCFTKQRNRDTETAGLKCVLAQLLIILRCFGRNGYKKLIVFDNIERFIGSDEVYNKELTDFLGDMRNFCDNYSDEYKDTDTNTDYFSKNYQFIVSMRNTTVRNHTPAEYDDFTRHSMDLSSWFSTGDIIHTKLDWYESHKIKVLDDTIQKHIKYILKDDGPAGDQTLRGLRPKLDLIFNYNKRLITSFLTDETLVEPVENQAHYLKFADYFYNNLSKDIRTASCASFGYRSVIWRSVLDWLRKGDLFKIEIFREYETSQGRISAINYVWRILSILHSFSVANNGIETESRGTEHYMPFLDLIQQVYNEQDNDDFAVRFYEESFSDERERMARLLYSLNYYDRNNNNWFHFIDIQYNVVQANRKSLSTWKVLLDLFLETKPAPEMLKIRITTAGKAYLGYVAPTFEFVSCMAEKLPLLCCLPTEEELVKYEVANLKCAQIICNTLQKIHNYITDLQPYMNNPNLFYHRTNDIPGQSYAERIVKSTYGYLSNFVDCIRRLVTVTSEDAATRKEELINLITTEADNLWNFYLPPKG